ncbi:NTPase [Palaeococcus sp. (in: euryarchaeotes)]
MVRIFISGNPGVGKTTLVLKVVEALKERGISAGGFITQEVRERGRRVGFKIRALDTGEEGILAWEGAPGPKIGKYGVNIADLNEIGVRAMYRALKEADLVVIDEIGAMEFKSKAFSRALEEVLKSKKPLLAVLHRRWVKRFEGYGELYFLSIENREQIGEEVMKRFTLLFEHR